MKKVLHTSGPVLIPTGAELCPLVTHILLLSIVLGPIVQNFIYLTSSLRPQHVK